MISLKNQIAFNSMIISCGYTRKCCNSIAKGKQTTCENGQRRSQLAAVVYKLGSNTVPRQGRRPRDLVGRLTLIGRAIQIVRLA